MKALFIELSWLCLVLRASQPHSWMHNDRNNPFSYDPPLTVYMDCEVVLFPHAWFLLRWYSWVPLLLNCFLHVVVASQTSTFIFMEAEQWRYWILTYKFDWRTTPEAVSSSSMPSYFIDTQPVKVSFCCLLPILVFFIEGLCFNEYPRGLWIRETYPLMLYVNSSCHWVWTYDLKGD